MCASDDDGFTKILGKSSDILLTFNDPTHTYAFLEELTTETDEYHDKFTINFVTLERNISKKSNHQFQLPSSAPYEHHYALNMLFSMGYVFSDKYSQKLHQKFSEFDKELFNTMCYYLKDQLKENHCYHITRVFDDFNDYWKEKRREKKNSIQELLPYSVGCILITPLRIVYERMEATKGNRAIRVASLGGPDMFVLVHIREEDGSKLRSFDRVMKSRLREKMLNGMEVVGKNYRLFGTSTSQLKEMSFWFFTSETRTIEEGWRELGDFSGIKNVANYIARIGLYFSTSQKTGVSSISNDRFQNVDSALCLDCV